MHHQAYVTHHTRGMAHFQSLQVQIDTNFYHGPAFTPLHPKTIRVRDLLPIPCVYALFSLKVILPLLCPYPVLRG